jgi:hypothetical protein
MNELIGNTIFIQTNSEGRPPAWRYRFTTSAMDFGFRLAQPMYYTSFKLILVTR